MKKSKFLQGGKDMLHRSFKPDKCKTSLRMGVSRLKLMRNKKEVQVKQLRREIAQLLESGHDPSARIKVEHVVREEKMVAAYELISLYSELVMSRMAIIESQKICPIDLKEAVTSLIFASPRCSDIPELIDVQKHFITKYGKDFVTAAVELRPDCGVSRLLVEKLSAKAPDGQTKLKILTSIAEEHSIKWDPKSFGDNDTTAPIDLLNGPSSFKAATERIPAPQAAVYAQSPQVTVQAQSPQAAVPAQSPRHEPSQVSQDHIHHQQQNDRFSQGTQNVNSTYGEGRQKSSNSDHEAKHSGIASERPTGGQSFSEDRSTFSSPGRNKSMEFKDAASAAQAAAESAEMASVAARAAAEMASRDSMKRPYYTESQQAGPHSKRDSSDFEGEQPQKHPSNSYHSDRHRRMDSDQLQGAKYTNPGEPQHSGSHLERDSSEYEGERPQKHSSNSYHFDRHRRTDSDQLQGAKYTNPGEPQHSGSHLERDSSEYEGERPQKHSSNSYHSDRHHRTDSDQLQGAKYTNPRESQQSGSRSKRDSSEFEREQPQKHSTSSYHSDRHRRSDSDQLQGAEYMNPGESQQSGSRSKRDSSEFAGEHPQKHSFNSHHSNRHQRADSDQLQGAKYTNPGGTPERSNQGSYHRIENSNRRNKFGSNDSVGAGSYGHSSPDAGKHSHSHRKSDSDKLKGAKSKKPRDTAERSNQGSYDRMENYNRRNNVSSSDSEADGSYGHSSHGAGKYSQKSMYKEEAAKHGSIAKPQSKESENRSDIHGRSDSEDFHHFQSVNSLKSMHKKGAAKPNKFSKPRKSHNIRAENSEHSDASDSDHRSYKSHTSGESQGRIHTDTSRTGSGNSGFAVFDEAASYHEDISFDTGPKYDEQDSDSDSMLAAPSKILKSPNKKDIGFSGSKVPKNMGVKQSSPSRKNSSHEFPVVSETLVEDFKFDDQLSTKFDSDDTSSEGENSTDESSHTSRKYSEKISNSKGQSMFSQKSSFKEKRKQGVVEKPHLKSTLDESDDELLNETNSDLVSKLNYGKLTGGLRHKRYDLPPYRKTQVDDATSPPRKPVQSSASKVLESTASITVDSQVKTEVKKSTNSRKSLSSSHEDSDTDSSEDDRPAQGSGFGKNTETNSKSKVSVPSVEPDSDEAARRLKQTPSGKNYMASGLSRRTKPTPASPGRTPTAQKKHGEPKSSYFSSGRKSAYSSYDSDSDDEPVSRRSEGTKNSRTSKLQPKREKSDDSDFSSDGSELKEEPVRNTATPNPGIPKVRPKLKGTNDSDFSSGRKSTFSSYGSHFTEETESSRRNSSPSKNSEQSKSNRKTSEQIPESKVPSRQESMKSTAAERVDKSQPKENTPGTTETSQASQVMDNAPSRLDNSAKPSHVHPKLPDYDSLAAFFKKKP